MLSTYKLEIYKSGINKDKDRILLYRSIMGSLNWVIVLGRFDILYATSRLSRFNMEPRKGHFDDLIRIPGYPQGRIIFNPNYP